MLLALKSLGEFGEHTTETEVAHLAQHIVDIWEKTFTTLLRLHGWRYVRPLWEQARVLGVFNLQIVAPAIMRVQQHDPDLQHFFYLPTASDLIDEAIPMNILWQLFQDKPISFYACHTARALQTPTVIERLVAILEDTNGNWRIEDRQVAVKLLGKMGAQTPVSLLIKTWQDTTLDDDLRAGAAEALSGADVPVPLDVFVAMLSDQDGSIRCTAIETLSKLHKQTYIDMLLSTLQDPAFYVRKSALHSLHTHGIAIPIKLLQALFYDKDDKDICKEAWNCLQEMGESVPLELWLDALQYEYQWTRDYALMAIEHSKDQIPVEPILALLSLPKLDNYHQKDVRTSCIQALGLLGDRVPLEPLMALLQHRDEELRLHALLVLLQRRVALPVDILLPMLDHSTTGRAAAQAIAALGVDAPISSLVEIAQSHSSNSTQYAIEALCLLYEHVPTKPLLELLQDEEMRQSYGGTYGKLIQLLQLQDVETVGAIVTSPQK